MPSAREKELNAVGMERKDCVEEMMQGEIRRS